jgi:hypothetical protein
MGMCICMVVLQRGSMWLPEQQCDVLAKLYSGFYGNHEGVRPQGVAQSLIV